MASQSTVQSYYRRMFYIALTCNFFATLIACEALATGIASVVAIDWFHFKEENMTGLFQGKNLTSGEYFYLDNIGFTEDWLYAVRAFFVMMIILGGLGLIFCIASLLRIGGEKVALLSAGLLFGAGVCGIVSCAVFSSQTDDALPGYWYGTGFILGWVSCWSYFVAGMMQGATGGKTEEYDVT